MKKKLVGIVLTAAMAASMMAGCGLSGSSTSSSTTAATDAAAPAATEAAADTTEAAADTTEAAADTTEAAAGDGEYQVNEAAAADPAVTLTMAEVNPLDTTTVGKVDTKFKEAVETMSGGSIKIDLQGSGVLGDESAVLDTMTAGGNDIDIARISAFALSNYGCTKTSLLTVPFTFVSRDHFWKFAKSDVAQEFLNESEEVGTGVRGLFYGEEGFRDFFTVNPISGIEDLKGMKLRVSNDPIMTGMVNDLGANPTVVDFNELYSALQTGVVDGAEQPVPNYMSNAFQEVAPNLIRDEHTLGVIEIVISDGAYDSLTENQQKVLADAAVVAQDYDQQVSQQTEDETIEKLKAAGVNIVDVPDKTPWQEACKNTIDSATKDNADLYQKILDLAN
ncbi:MAG: TRAP transporter substrate-binding protein [Lachnospiraceae bacterium]|nr:TRAP transporter substrate-binding protein [Lachnospiraceae bacterium]